MENKLSKMVLVLEYDGTEYCGFQFQAIGNTVQAELEKALAKLTSESRRIVGASRTDSGVHAEGQVASFFTASSLKLEAYVRGLNYYLPRDIAVKEVYKVNQGFSVQREAISREYRYRIWNSDHRSPLHRQFYFEAPGKLREELMDEAAQMLVGEHDLASFVTEIKRSVVKSTVKRVLRVQVAREGALVVFDIEAKSFLPHQVRNTVGCLVRVGQGKLGKEQFRELLEARKPGLAGPTAPARGLTLMKVNYPKPLGEYHEDL